MPLHAKSNELGLNSENVRLDQYNCTNRAMRHSYLAIISFWSAVRISNEWINDALTKKNVWNFFFFLNPNFLTLCRMQQYFVKDIESQELCGFGFRQRFGCICSFLTLILSCAGKRKCYNEDYSKRFTLILMLLSFFFL